MKKTYSRHSLSCGDKLDITQPRILFLVAENLSCSWIVHSTNKKEYYTLAEHSRGFFITGSSRLEILSGQLNYRDISCAHLAKLQAFIDRGMQENITPSNHYFSSLLPINMPFNADKKIIEYGYLTQAIGDSAEWIYFSNVLRNTEWYRLVSFLLDESNADSNQRLQDLCLRYGLSAAHFRRLSSQALGNTTKVEWRDWRLTRALFELAGERKNITTVAMNHGYASLSHFSNEVKEVLGISPRSLKKVMANEAAK